MAFDMHIKFEGTPQIQGTSKHSKHPNEVPIHSWSWGLSNGGSLHTTGGTSGGGKASVSDITVMKSTDKASVALIQACFTGAALTKATLFVTNATGTQTDYLTLTMENVRISSFQCSTGGEDVTESFSLHFQKITYAFQPQKDDGSKEGGVAQVALDMQAVTKS